MNQALLVPQSIGEALTKHSIIPDIFSKATNTSHLTKALLTVEYPNNLSVTMGNVLPIDKTQQAPNFQCLAIPSSAKEESSVNPIDLNSKYTMVMTDPDAPSRTDNDASEFCHWVVTNLSASNADKTINVVKYDPKTAVELVPYMGPGPPKGTGLHRYCFCLFKGLVDSKSSLVQQINNGSRRKWGYETPGTGIEQFVKDHEGSLELISVNFFFAENK